MGEVEVIVAHQERATLRIGDTFLKVDSDPVRLEREVEAMRIAPIPTPTVLWHRSPALALARLPGKSLGRLELPSTASPKAWRAAGAAVRRLHDAPLPPWSGRSVEDLAAQLESECEWLVANDALPIEVVARNRERAEMALRPSSPVFVHGDLQIVHVFVDEDDEVTGVLDWSEAAPGDAHADLATLTLAHEEHLDDVLAGYGADDVDVDRIRAWWSLRCLLAVRWLAEHGYGPLEEMTEVAVLRSLA